MLGRRLILLALAIALSGCVLQSRGPLYGDDRGVLVLGPEGGLALIEDMENRQWQDQKEDVTLTVEGRHYVARSKDTKVEMTFVKLGGDDYLLQAADSQKTAVYMLAKVRNKVAEVRPLACSDLKKDGGFGLWIEFAGDECYARPGIAPDKLFRAALALPAKATTRISIVKAAQ